MASPREPFNSRRITPTGGDQHTPSQSRAERRRKVVAIVVVAGLLLSSGGAVVAVVISALAGGDSQPAPIPTTSTVSVPPPVALDLPTAGATAGADAACPEPDGSSARTTSFAGPPPICLATTPDGEIDTSVEYTAIIGTTAGDLTYLLTTARAPQSVNAFVFLARYGFWDGAPIDAIVPLAWAETGARFAGSEPTPGDPSDAGASLPPGFVIPSEAPTGGMVSTPGMLAMAPTSDDSSEPGRLLIALGDRAAALPEATTFFGVLLDGAPTLAAIQQAGSEDGRPWRQITVTDIEVTTEPAP